MKWDLQHRHTKSIGQVYSEDALWDGDWHVGDQFSMPDVAMIPYVYRLGRRDQLLGRATTKQGCREASPDRAPVCSHLGSALFNEQLQRESANSKRPGIGFRNLDLLWTAKKLELT
jgi:hypothetical protein